MIIIIIMYISAMFTIKFIILGFKALLEDYREFRRQEAIRIKQEKDRKYRT